MSAAATRVDRFRELREAGSRVVAERLGLRRSARGRFACICDPEAEPAIAIVGTTGWRCHRCGAKGDAAALAAWITSATVRPTGWAATLSACASVGLCSSAEGDPAPTLPPPPPARPVPERKPPPVDEVRQLWEMAGPADEDAGLRRWIERTGKRIDLARCAGLDLCRVLAPGARGLPEWAGISSTRRWPSTGHRLIAPLFDAEGRMRSVVARRIVDGDARLKILSPAGHAVGRLVFADAVGRALLAGADELEGWPEMSAAEFVRARGVVITEGLTDYLTIATAEGDGPAPAVIGVQSGSWSAAHATRIPPDAAVLVATDADPAGDAYARELLRTLGHACTLRTTPEKVPALIAELRETAAGSR